jgi:hypothetical protein
MGRVNWLFREPRRDPELAAVLRRIEPASDRSLEEALRLRILEAARARAARLKAATPPWWEWISAWIPVAVPVGLTACLAAALLLPGEGDLVGAGESAAETGADSAMVLATFTDPGFGNQVTARLIAPEGDDWLLAQAFVR